MPVCPKCKAEYIEGIAFCSDCGVPLVDDDEAYAPVMTTLISAEAPLAERIVEFLSYSGLDVQMDFDKKADLFSIMLPDTQYDEGIKLLKVLLANEALHTPRENEGGQEPAPGPQARVYVKASDKYADIRSSAFSFLAVGAALMLVLGLIYTETIRLPLYGDARLLTCSVMTGMGVLFLIIGIVSWHKSRLLKAKIDEEERFTSSVYQWFLTTYTAPQIDLTADAEMDQDVAMNPEKQFTIISEEIRCLKRMDVIREFLKREYQGLDDSYVEYLCEELYQMVFEA